MKNVQKVFYVFVGLFAGFMLAVCFNSGEYAVADDAKIENPYEPVAVFLDAWKSRDIDKIVGLMTEEGMKDCFGTEDAKKAKDVFKNMTEKGKSEIAKIELEKAAFKVLITRKESDSSEVVGSFSFGVRKEKESWKIDDFNSVYSVNETAAIACMRTISSTMEMYCSRYGAYPGSLKKLGDAQYIDQQLASGVRKGYKFRITKASKDYWAATAVPVNGKGRGFWVDFTGVIRFSTDGSEPSEKSPALDR
ncbi:MAG: hypothetical protein ACYS8W_02350 [Planctomycetota bacterium]|jgi:hypothetical protein